MRRGWWRLARRWLAVRWWSWWWSAPERWWGRRRWGWWGAPEFAPSGAFAGGSNRRSALGRPIGAVSTDTGETLQSENASAVDQCALLLLKMNLCCQEKEEDCCWKKDVKWKLVCCWFRYVQKRALLLPAERHCDCQQLWLLSKLHRRPAPLIPLLLLQCCFDDHLCSFLQKEQKCFQDFWVIFS